MLNCLTLICDVELFKINENVYLTEIGSFYLHNVIFQGYAMYPDKNFTPKLEYNSALLVIAKIKIFYLLILITFMSDDPLHVLNFSRRSLIYPDTFISY